MVKKLSKNRTTQRQFRDQMHSVSCQLLAREEVEDADVVVVPAHGTAIGQNSRIEKRTMRRNAMAFGPARCFTQLPLFCREKLRTSKTIRLGELSDGLQALLTSLFQNQENPAIYGSVKYLEQGTDDFAIKEQNELDPQWIMSEDGEGVLEFEMLRNGVSSHFPEGVTDTRICGLEAGTTIDIKRLPFEGDPALLHMFNGDLTAKVVYPFNGYWRETTTVLAVPEALNDHAFQCRWAFSKCKEASSDIPSTPLFQVFLPVVSFYALTHPGVGGRYSVQEVSVILNREHTAVMGLQICYTSLHGWLLREGNLAGLGAFLI